MNNGSFTIHHPLNEAGLSYRKGSAEREALKKEIKRQYEQRVEIPCIIGGEEVYTGNTIELIVPFEKDHVLGVCHLAGPEELRMAKEAALSAHPAWGRLPHEQRAMVFLKAARMLTGTHHDLVCAATILNQSKSVFETEGDSGSGVSDFIRYNVYNAQAIYGDQPLSTEDMINRISWRPLEGFVAAISPFNYVSDASNLAIAPAVAGNTVVWKPSSLAILSNYYVMRTLMEAGLPAGVINFVPARSSDVSRHLLPDPDLAGIHFIGSTDTFRELWKTVGANIGTYKNYPRLVGETGGKNFMLAYQDCDVDALVCSLIRGAFELSGQKCSATSRAYIPESLWEEVKTKLLAEIEKIKVGPASDFDTLVPAVIDRNAFDKIRSYIDRAAASPEAELLTGHYDDSKGYFVWPTLIRCKDPRFVTMTEEIFGPVLSVYVYPDEDLAGAVKLVDESTAYALTGAIYARDRAVISYLEEALRYACGNLYINDKSTGAIPGYVPFGGGRASGTNDKAGSKMNMLRWVSPQTIKETLVPGHSWKQPCMEEK